VKRGARMNERIAKRRSWIKSLMRSSDDSAEMTV
jgi:hypothetical protein